MSDMESYTEYGVFVWHGSAQMLYRTFRKFEVLELWRDSVLPDGVQIASIKTRPMTVQYGEWTEVEA